MREDLTLLFCVLAAVALIFGRAHMPPDFLRAYAAYEAASERGDERRAAWLGERALLAARDHPLMIGSALARLELMVGASQDRAGNPQRARELYGLALEGLGAGTEEAEIAEAQARLSALDQELEDRTRLRGTDGIDGPGG